MKQHEIRKGTRLVVITEQEAGRFSARLYLNNGETASLQAWRGQTFKGAQAWAKRMVNA